MTIKMKLHNGDKLRTEIFRQVYKGKNYAELVESFYAFVGDMKWGELIQLKGRERIILHKFGRTE